MRVKSCKSAFRVRSPFVENESEEPSEPTTRSAKMRVSGLTLGDVLVVICVETSVRRPTSCRFKRNRDTRIAVRLIANANFQSKYHDKNKISVHLRL